MTNEEIKWLEECFRGVREDVAGVNSRLDKINGSVRSHGDKLIAHDAVISVAVWFAGVVVVALVGLAVKVLAG